MRNNKSWYDQPTKKEDVKTFGSTELSMLRSLVKDVLATCEADDTGVTEDLYDKALTAAEILGIVHVPDLDPDDGEEDGYRKLYPRDDDE